MRKSDAETAETRKRILAVASVIFLKKGIANTGISDVMVAAGLTQGGFYRHFESKEQLVAEANATAFEKILVVLETAALGKPPREAVLFITECYLHQHRSKAATNLCPMANLSSELRNGDEQSKTIITEGYARFVKLFASYLMRLDYPDYMGMAEAIVSVIVGAVSISQLTTNAELSETVLKNAQVTVSIILQSAFANSRFATTVR